ncbi:MAG: hypothetical protein Q4C85_07995 [Actinomyces sp.]|uniref:hypothetical protein n=1 Tax=Actinomyces sp. TaxID=29317 RepID=UPI0026DB13D6|nr:hypothetical protein [Actinomyces sp.]MDO4243683.1 hypothetical protein [Actinomyces sp.]
MPVGGGSRAVVLLDQLSRPLPPLALADVTSRLPRLLPGLDDPAWSLEGLVRLLPGWTVSQGVDPSGARCLTVSDGAGGAVLVEYALDDQGRLVSIRLHHEAAAPDAGPTGGD